MNDAGRDIAAMLWGGAVVAVVLRGAVWVYSGFTLGPVLGFADTLAGLFAGHRDVLFWQSVITVLTVVAAIIGGLGMQSDPARYRWPVRLLAGLFVVDAILYLAPMVALFTVEVPYSTGEWALFVVAVVGNLGLAGLGLLIVLRSARPEAAPAPAAMSPAASPATSPAAGRC